MARRLTNRQKADLAAAATIRSLMPLLRARAAAYDMSGTDPATVFLDALTGKPTQYQIGFTSGLYAAASMFEAVDG